MPARSTLSVPELVATTIEPVSAPRPAGVNVTVAAQEALAARVAQLCVTPKELDTVTPETVMVVEPMFVSVIDCEGAVVFIDCPPKSSDAGLAESAVATAGLGITRTGT